GKDHCLFATVPSSTTNVDRITDFTPRSRNPAASSRRRQDRAQPRSRLRPWNRPATRFLTADPVTQMRSSTWSDDISRRAPVPSGTRMEEQDDERHLEDTPRQRKL